MANWDLTEYEMLLILESLRKYEYMSAKSDNKFQQTLGIQVGNLRKRLHEKLWKQMQP